MAKPHYIKQLISGGEGLHLDFKFEVSDAAKIARSLVAFANTEGGKLLIGVNDNGSIAGIRSEEECFMIKDAAVNHCRPEVKFTSKEWQVGSKKVLEVNIPKSDDYPHKAPDHKGAFKAFFRFEDQNLLASGVMMKVWIKQQSENNVSFVYSEEAKLLLVFLQENESISLKEAMTTTNTSKFEAEHLISDLIILDVLQMTTTVDSQLFSLK